MKKKFKYIRNGRITDFNDLFVMAEKKENVIWVAGFINKTDYLRPAAFFLQWSLAKLKSAVLYKVNKIPIDET